ncbi:uncharacterized protein M421DRAFT_271750 [Didymella exigua CBS 183.55]|uniref:Uncharacterized protein n=1 Tax=Didymella exigua CBS 183.55 TaxID=1150837 RepID=A0A6A5RGU8_9PLEO|nr:uncharacterized protein M421DRAFT_271750 [Didymella exigua CBS 183.55]KAF1924837.1 hypothetical protein M421DRAFT_271750 [Didymella exigua CBS 183.55]
MSAVDRKHSSAGYSSTARLMCPEFQRLTLGGRQRVGLYILSGGCGACGSERRWGVGVSWGPSAVFCSAGSEGYMALNTWVSHQYMSIASIHEYRINT